jgi:hypothetical protein
MEKIMTVPEFTTLEDMTQFWNTHNITDFEESLVEVTESIFDLKGNRVITIMLDEEHYRLLNRIAEHAHLNATALVNEWIIEMIEENKNICVVNS